MYLLPGRMKLQPKPQNIPTGMQTSTATVENSVEIPLKTRSRTAIQRSNPTAGHTH